MYGLGDFGVGIAGWCRKSTVQKEPAVWCNRIVVGTPSIEGQGYVAALDRQI